MFGKQFIQYALLTLVIIGNLWMCSSLNCCIKYAMPRMDSQRKKTGCDVNIQTSCQS